MLCPQISSYFSIFSSSWSLYHIITLISWKTHKIMHIHIDLHKTTCILPQNIVKTENRGYALTLVWWFRFWKEIWKSFWPSSLLWRDLRILGSFKRMIVKTCVHEDGSTIKWNKSLWVYMILPKYEAWRDFPWDTHKYTRILGRI